MLGTYSTDLRRRTVRYVEAGHSRRETVRVLDVSASFVIILLRRYTATGNSQGKLAAGYVMTACRDI